MSFMRVGLGAVPRNFRQPVTRLRIPILVRKRGMGDTACGPGLVMDNRTDPPHCILEQYAYKLPTALTAYNYPQAPGCNVVDLSKNSCLLDDGTEYGCNGIQECDPLTNAVHYQYALPGGPIAGQPAALKTLGVNLVSVPTNNAAMAPNLSLKNPTGGTAFTPTNPLQIQKNVDAALGKTTSATFQAAQSGGSAGGSSSSSSGSGSAGSGGAGGNGSGGSATPGAFDFLTNPVSIFGFAIPTWGIIAALGFGVYAFAGKHR